MLGVDSELRVFSSAIILYAFERGLLRNIITLLNQPATRNWRSTLHNRGEEKYLILCEFGMLSRHCLGNIPLHSEQPKLNRVLAILSAIGLNCPFIDGTPFCMLYSRVFLKEPAFLSHV